jgi:hypothetical protein
MFKRRAATHPEIRDSEVHVHSSTPERSPGVRRAFQPSVTTQQAHPRLLRLLCILRVDLAPPSSMHWWLGALIGRGQSLTGTLGRTDHRLGAHLGVAGGHPSFLLQQGPQDDGCLLAGGCSKRPSHGCRLLTV